MGHGNGSFKALQALKSVENTRLRTLESMRSKKQNAGGWPALQSRSIKIYERYYTAEVQICQGKNGGAKEIYFHEAGKRGLGIDGVSYWDCGAARRLKVGQRTMEAIVALCCCVSLE